VLVHPAPPATVLCIQASFFLVCCGCGCGWFCIYMHNVPGASGAAAPVHNRTWGWRRPAHPVARQCHRSEDSCSVQSCVEHLEAVRTPACHGALQAARDEHLREHGDKRLQAFEPKARW
jgi:hypothetical protein